MQYFVMNTESPKEQINTISFVYLTADLSHAFSPGEPVEITRSIVKVQDPP